MVGRFDVVAKVLVARAERVDVVAGGVTSQEEQRGQGHQRRLAGFVRALELYPAVGVPDLSGVVLPHVHHARALRLPPVGAS
jgi:hypothetical protein